MTAPTKPIQEPYLPKPYGGSEQSGGPSGTADNRDRHVDTGRQSSNAKPTRITGASKSWDRTEKWVMSAGKDNEQLQKPVGAPGTSDDLIS